MNCSAMLLHVQFTYEVYGCVLTAQSMLQVVHTCRYNGIAKSGSASRQVPISMDAWVYLHKQVPCEQTCLDVQMLPLFLTLSDWKKDRIIHLPVESVLTLPDHGGLTRDRCPVSKQLCVYLVVGWGQSATPTLPYLLWNERNAHVGRALILFLFIKWAWLHSVTGNVQLWSGQSSTGCSSAQVSAEFTISSLIS